MSIVDTLFETLNPIRLIILNNPLLLMSAIIILSFFIAFFTLYIFKHYIKDILHKTKNKVSEKVLGKIQNPVVILIVLVGFQVALEKIIFEKILFFSLLESLIIVIITYVIMTISDTLLDVWGHNYTKKKGAEFDEEVLPLTKGTVKLIIGIVGLLFVLDSWGVQVGPLLLSLGVAGAILGLALKDTLSNIFGGISLIVDKDFHIGDVIELDNGEQGFVQQISLRSTRIKTYDNLVMIIPNSVLSTTKFKNFAKPSSTIRINVPVSVVYGTNPHIAEEVLHSALKDNPKILKYPKREIRFEAMGDYGIHYSVLFFISDYNERFEIKNQVSKDIYDALYKNNMAIPYPTRTIMTAKPKPYKPTRKF